MERQVATAEQFFALCEAGKVTLTRPQSEILHHLRQGWKIWIVNTHHASGGQWAWKRPDYSRPEYAGKVYRAFWNLIYNVLYKNGYRATAPAEFFHEEEWRGQL